MSWTQWDHVRCCSSFLCEVISKNILATFDDVTWPHGCRIAKVASRESGMVMTDIMHDRDCYYDEYLSKMSQLIFPPLTYNGQVVGFYVLITSSNFQSTRSSTLALTRSQSCKMVMWGRVIQTDLVFPLSTKNLRGGADIRPPSVRELKSKVAGAAAVVTNGPLQSAEIDAAETCIINPRPHMGGWMPPLQVGFVLCTPCFWSWRSDFCYSCFLNLS